MTRSRETSSIANTDYNKNAIINGNFDFWQRGISLPLDGGGIGVERYISDRWLNATVGASQCSSSRQTFTYGQADVPNNPTYFIRVNVVGVAGAGNRTELVQRIEKSDTFSNETVTISFWAKADSSYTISSKLVQQFGSGGSPSASVEMPEVNHSVTTTWQKFSSTFTLPSVLGKTVGTNGDDRLTTVITLESNDTIGTQSGTFDIAQVQVEKGNIATDFELKPLAQELNMCQRYYEKSFDINIAPAQAVGTFLGSDVVFLNAGGGASLTPRFKVEKRIPPTITTYNPTQANANWRRTDNGNDATASVTGANTSAFLITAASGTADGRYAIHWTASAEI